MNNPKYIKCQEFDYLSSYHVKSAEYMAQKNHHNYYDDIDKDTFECLWGLIKSNDWDKKCNGHDMLFYLNGYKQNHYYIQVKNIVGILNLKNGVIVELLPKIYFDDSCSLEERQRKTRWKLAEMFSETEFQSYRLIQNVDRGTFNLPLSELGRRLYLDLISRLVQRGVKADYVSKTDNTTSYHGRIDYQNQIKYNAAHKERFYMFYDEFSVDSPMNRLIKSALTEILKYTRDSENQKRARQLSDFFSDVKRSVNPQTDYSKKTKSRNFPDYNTAVDWSFAIINGKNYDTFFLGNLTDHTNLIPMEELFENYVALNLEPICRKKNWQRFRRQDNSQTLFDSGPTKNRWQSIRPDITFVAEGHPIIMDTKWKFINTNYKYANQKPTSLVKCFNIETNDLYQMFAYAIRFHANDIWLLYPRNENQPKKLPLKFESQNKDWPDINIHVFTIDLMKVDDSLNQLVADVEREIHSPK